MVKFSKQLEAQLIPEWKEAFVNYWQLKKQVKKIKLSKIPKQPPQIDFEFGRSIVDPVRFIAHKLSKSLFSSGDSSPEIIQVRSKTMEGGNEDEYYQTELLQLFSDEDEVRVFFERLDDELNKVNQFYKARETELLERGDLLNKQLEILTDLKRVLTNRRRKPGFFPHSNSWSSSPRNSDFSETTNESSNETPGDASETEEVIASLEKNGVNFINSAMRSKSKKGNTKMSLRIDVPATNPTRTISAITSMLWEDLVNNPKKEGQTDFVNRKKIQCAEKMIRGAFVELYRGLGLLKTYSSLNMMAFTKILKKFDKNRRAVNKSWTKKFGLD